MIVITDAEFDAGREQIVRLARQNHLPTLYEHRAFVEAGGLISYGPDIDRASYRAAAYVDKLLKGAKPADLPIEQPTVFELLANLKTANALGLTIPPTLLARAYEVIEYRRPLPFPSRCPWAYPVQRPRPRDLSVQQFQQQAAREGQLKRIPNTCHLA
jgi:hypothetical protein